MSAITARIRLGLLISCGVLAVAFSFALIAQDAPTVQQPAATPAQVPPAAAPTQAPAAASTSPSPASASGVAPQFSEAGGITEEELRGMLIGKQLFLRGGYLDNTLSFNEHGVLAGHSAQGSYTLCEIQVDKLHLTKHKLELEGQRYGLHFLGAMPYEDPTKAVDRVNITPKKKVVKITIDREIVVKPKQPKEKKEKNKSDAKPANPASATAAAPTAAPAPPAPSEAATVSDAQQKMPAAPPPDHLADSKTTTTTSPAHAAQVLKDALNNVFAQPFDGRMMDAMPDFWKLYYEAAANKTDYRPKDPAVLRESQVDTKAHLTTNFEPQSNQYAQDHGVAGMSLYHVVVDADGKPGEIAVARPIGFGLDENAVDAIRKATFTPATKDGKPVPVLLDLVVQFRIYSKMTNVVEKKTEQPAKPALPGPYSVDH